MKIAYTIPYTTVHTPHNRLQDHRCEVPDGGVVVGGEVRVAPVQPVIQNSDPHPAPAQPAAPHRRHVQGDVGQAGPGPGVLQYRWCTMENAMRTFYELLTYLYKCYMEICCEKTWRYH